MQDTPTCRSARRVQLVRLPHKLDNSTWGPVPDVGANDVSAKSYDDYHGQGPNVHEIKTLRRSLSIRIPARGLQANQ